MQLTSRTALTLAAVSVGFATIAGVIGMSRIDAEPESAAASVPTPAWAEPTPAVRPYPDPRPVPVNALLLPNLRSLPPEDIAIRVADGQRQLWFSSIIANAGLGPTEVVPDGPLPCPAGQRHGSQVLYRDTSGNGHYDPAADQAITTRPGGCMLHHPDHQHWHFDAMARYSLTRVGERSPLVGFDKVSFCLRDNRETPSASPVRPPKHYGDCGRDKVQGITPGWADVYDTTLPTQNLVLPANLPDGTYCLRNEADPLQLLLETVEEDNAAGLAIRITAQSVTPDPSTPCA